MGKRPTVIGLEKCSFSQYHPKTPMSSRSCVQQRPFDRKFKTISCQCCTGVLYVPKIIARSATATTDSGFLITTTLPPSSSDGCGAANKERRRKARAEEMDHITCLIKASFAPTWPVGPFLQSSVINKPTERDEIALELKHTQGKALQSVWWGTSPMCQATTILNLNERVMSD